MEKENLLKRMAQHLMLNASYINNPGLYHGKMGIILFFCHYSRHTNNSLYEAFAGELLDEIYDEIHAGTPLDFESGLCGIGWGMEYLIQQGYLQADPDEILSDIDKRVMERDPRRITNHTFKTGLGGILYYALTRLTSSKKEKRTLPLDAVYFSDLWETAKKNLEKEVDMGCNSLILQFFNEGYDEKLNLKTVPFFNIIDSNNIVSDLKNSNFGLEKGCAGIGLKMILV